MQLSSLPVVVEHVIYHHWYDLNSGKRTGGTGCTKSCPGTSFFGGNSVEAAQKYFIPQIREGLGMNFDKAIDLIAKRTGIDAAYWQPRKDIDPYFDVFCIKIAEVMKG